MITYFGNLKLYGDLHAAVAICHMGAVIAVLSDTPIAAAIAGCAMPLSHHDLDAFRRSFQPPFDRGD